MTNRFFHKTSLISTEKKEQDFKYGLFETYIIKGFLFAHYLQV